MSDVMELPGTMETARMVSKEFGAAAFVKHIEGDIATLNLSKKYDVVFLGNIIHHLQKENAGAVLSKLRKAMVSGGTMAVWDLSGAGQQTDEIAACFSLFFYITSGAKCYSEQEVFAMLKNAGFGDIKSYRPPGNSTHILYTALNLN